MRAIKYCCPEDAECYTYTKSCCFGNPRSGGINSRNFTYVYYRDCIRKCRNRSSPGGVVTGRRGDGRSVSISRVQEPTVVSVPAGRQVGDRTARRCVSVTGAGQTRNNRAVSVRLLNPAPAPAPAPAPPKISTRCSETQTHWSLGPVDSYFFMKNSDSVFAFLYLIYHLKTASIDPV